MTSVTIPISEQSVFVYGNFGQERDTLPRLHLEPSIAIEILREFSPGEFIGKVYVKIDTTWRPLTPNGASSYNWYNEFNRGEPSYFEMKGSGKWQVEWFRFESSARSPNPYLAVALRQKKNTMLSPLSGERKEPRIRKAKENLLSHRPGRKNLLDY